LQQFPAHDAAKNSRNSLRVLGRLSITLGFAAIAVGVGIYGQQGVKSREKKVRDMIYMISAGFIDVRTMNQLRIKNYGVRRNS
jgi:hypothetical protein